MKFLFLIMVMIGVRSFAKDCSESEGMRLALCDIDVVQKGDDKPATYRSIPQLRSSGVEIQVNDKTGELRAVSTIEFNKPGISGLKIAAEDVSAHIKPVESEDDNSDLVYRAVYGIGGAASGAYSFYSSRNIRQLNDQFDVSVVSDKKVDRLTFAPHHVDPYYRVTIVADGHKAFVERLQSLSDGERIKITYINAHLDRRAFGQEDLKVVNFIYNENEKPSAEAERFRKKILGKNPPHIEEIAIFNDGEAIKAAGEKYERFRFRNRTANGALIVSVVAMLLDGYAYSAESELGE
jgi:hypothetical protein